MTSLWHHRVLRGIHRVRVKQSFLSEGGSGKETFTHFLDGFLFYSSLLLSSVFFLLYNFPLQLILPLPSFQGDIVIAMCCHSVSQMNDCNEYKTNCKKQHIFHIPYTIEHFMCYRRKQIIPRIHIHSYLHNLL